MRDRSSGWAIRSGCRATREPSPSVRTTDARSRRQDSHRRVPESPRRCDAGDTRHPLCRRRRRYRAGRVFARREAARCGRAGTAGRRLAPRSSRPRRRASRAARRSTREAASSTSRSRRTGVSSSPGTKGRRRAGAVGPRDPARDEDIRGHGRQRRGQPGRPDRGDRQRRRYRRPRGSPLGARAPDLRSTWRGGDLTGVQPRGEDARDGERDGDRPVGCFRRPARDAAWPR